MSKLQKTVSILLLTAVLLLLVLLPKYVSTMLDAPDYIDWLRPKREEFRGVINAWHIVRFRPYLGSLGSWLKKYASVIEKRHFGVYLNFESLSEEEAESRIANGEMPDIISFPPGFMLESNLAVLSGEYAVDTLSGMRDDKLLAVPYAASCRLLLLYPGMLSLAELEADPGIAGKYSFEEFKSDSAPCCIADAREAGDMQRLLSANKAEYFEAKSFEKSTGLVQFIGVYRSIAEEKRGIAEEFISLITAEKAQNTLLELGLMPMNTDAELEYEESFLTDAYRLIREGGGAVASAFEREADRE